MIVAASHEPAAPVRQFARFVVVGASNTVLSFAAYMVLVLAGTPYVPAAAIAFGVGAVNGYMLNRRWTFAAPDSLRARVNYVVVQALGALASSALVWLLVRDAGTGRIGAYVVATPPITIAMFAANRLWTFADRH